MSSNIQPHQALGARLAHLPAVAAIVLGALYGIGAFSKTAELRGEGLAVRDTLPLIPLEQILTRGMAAVLNWFLWILLTLAVAYLNLYLIRRITTRRKIRDAIAGPKASGHGHVRSRSAALAAAAVFSPLLVLALFLPPLLVAVWFIVIPMTPFFTKRGAPGAYVHAILLVFSLAVLANSFVEPQPLPDVRVSFLPTTPGGEGSVLVGRLVADAGQNVYVAVGGRKFVAVDRDAASRVTISSAPQREWDSTHVYLMEFLEWLGWREPSQHDGRSESD